MAPPTLTYNSLLADLIAYTERGSVSDSTISSQLPRIINIAERSILHDLRIQGFEKSISFTLTAGQSVYPKPSDWRATITLTFVFENIARPIPQRSFEIAKLNTNVVLTGYPIMWAEHGPSEIFIAPRPDQTYETALRYWGELTFLEPAVQTNWLTTNVPELLLYRSLQELGIFLKDMELLRLYTERYNELKAAISAENSAKFFDRTVLRSSAP